MQQQLHKNNIPCHTELGSASHPVCHSVGVSINKTSTFQIPKFSNLYILLFSILYSLFSVPAKAQPYQWDWKLSGGSSNSNTINEALTNFDSSSEQIYDIKVGTDNNYYFLATVRGTYGVHLNNQSIKTNGNKTSGGNDIFLFSTTCDGSIRWSQAIGGGRRDRAYNLVLDSSNNVYIGATMDLGNSNWSEDFPVRFSATDSLSGPVNDTIVSDFWKTIFLVKYSSNGQYIGKKALQGDLSGGKYLPRPLMSDLVIDSQDQLHFIVGLEKGTYFDGNVNVPANYIYDPVTQQRTKQYHLVTYDHNLNYIISKLLPFSSDSAFPWSGTTRFAYDENLNRYYLAGMRSEHLTHDIIPLTYGGKAFVERSYILAINGTDGSEVWRREIHNSPFGSNISSNEITSLIVDPFTSDVYIGGCLTAANIPETTKIYDPNNPTTTTYTFQTNLSIYVPLVVKFNSSGSVQWVKTPTARTPNFTTDGPINFKGFAFRYNEIAFGGGDFYYAWDSFSTSRPQFYQPDAVLLRFNKQTGTTVGMDVIPGYGDEKNRILAVAADNDGNYITGGIFFNGIFRNSNNNDLADLVGTLYTDFFVAKLAASTCGTAVSTDNFSKLNINVYPNPTYDIMNIETQEILHNYEVYNILGQQIQKGNFNSNNQINLHGATAGTYFIKVTTTQGSTATVKVIKK